MFKRILSALTVMIMISVAASAQTKMNGTATTIDGMVEIDKIVHDFGDVITGSGPLSCTFTVKNISDKPLVIYTVSVSCGCTDAQWTKEPIQKGKTGVISVVYENNDGPYPFDKNLTVYFSGVKKPVILKLRGQAHDRVVPITEMFPVHLGSLGIKEAEIKAGNLSQGSQKNDVLIVANVGKKPMDLKFTNVSSELTLNVSPNPVPPGETARVRFVVSSNRSKWGKNYYFATPVVDGKPQQQLAFWAFTKEDFSNWTEAQRSKAAQPVFDTNTFNFGQVKPGTKVKATFTVKNQGKSDFVVYKVDSDWAKTVVSPVKPVGAGKSDTYTIEVDTTGMPQGENMVIITMTTNTPNRPLVNLFIGGAVKN